MTSSSTAGPQHRCLGPKVDEVFMMTRFLECDFKMTTDDMSGEIGISAQPHSPQDWSDPKRGATEPLDFTR